MSILKAQFFGSPCFLRRGQHLRPGRRKVVALAAYLMVNRKSYSREHLAALLWPESNRARASLRQALSLMASSLGRFWFSSDREQVGFVPHKSLWVDVTAFETLTVGSCLGALEQAVQLYGGGFLDGLYPGESSGFQEWQLERGRQLARRYLLALEELSRGHMGAGHLEKAVEYASAWVDADPFNEGAHRCLIRLFGGSGRRDLARCQYEKCLGLLDKELGVAPEPRTSALIQDIFSTAQPKPSLDHSVMPPSAFPLVGRDGEMKSILSLLDQGALRLLNIVGPGGIGKTRLAMEVTRQLEGGFRDGVFFISLAKVDSPGALVGALVHGLGLRLDPLGDGVQDFLFSKELLLVLDNLDPFPGAARWITALLDRCQGVKILATSRSRLSMAHEHLFPLPGLACPGLSKIKGPIGEDEIKGFCTLGSPALFLSAIGRVNPDFRVDGENIYDLLRVCQLTGGMPLALILAGGWGDAFSPGEMGDGIQESIDFLRSENPEGDHGSIRAVFDLSWKGLSPGEREVFMGLSVFRGRFSRGAALAVAGSGEILTSLVRKSMVTRAPDPYSKGRSRSGFILFEFHPLLARYGEEKLRATGGLERILDAHMDYYLGLIQGQEAALTDSRMLAARRALDLEFANVAQGWNRAVEKKALGTLSGAARGLYVYFDMHTRYAEGARFFRDGAQLALASGGAGPGGILVLSWFDMDASGSIPWDGLVEYAHGWLRWGTRDLGERALALVFMGALAQAKKSYGRAVRLYTLALKWDSRMDRFFWVNVRIGLCLRAQGRLEAALVHFEKSLTQGREDALKRAWCLGNMGALRLGLGQVEGANLILKSALGEFEALDAPRGILACLEELGLIALSKGQWEGVFSLFDRGLGLVKAHGLDPSVFKRGLGLRGLAQVMAGAVDEGRRNLEILGPQPGFTALLGLGIGAVMEDELPRAKYYLSRAEKAFVRVHKPQFIPFLDRLRRGVGLS